MNHEEQITASIRREIDAELAFLNTRPSRRDHIMRLIEREKKMKKNVSFVLVFASLLVFITGAAAFSSISRENSTFPLTNSHSPEEVNPDYLLTNLQQKFESPHLRITVIDTYWNGYELSVTCRILPVENRKILRMSCPFPDCDHSLPTDDADILLAEGCENIQFIDTSGNITKPKGYSYNWNYEKDGSISAIFYFFLSNMDQTQTLCLSFGYTLVETNEEYLSTLQIAMPILPDPIPPHEHDWISATCVSQKRCSICHRREGELGSHTFRPSEDGQRFECTVCKHGLTRYERLSPTTWFEPGEKSNFTMMLQLRLQELGYYDGPLGAYDEATIEAVKAFQESHGLEIDIHCTGKTIELLYSE